MTDNMDVRTANEIYDAGAKDLEAALDANQAAYEDGKALGILSTIEYQNAHNEMLKYAVLYQVKRAKEYKKKGMSWSGFCAHLGENVRTVDRVLADMRPIYDKFSDKMSELSGLPLSQIRYLGRSVSDNMSEIDGDAIIVDDRRIILKPENKDEIESVLKELKESHKRELKAKDEAIEAERKLSDTYRKKTERQEKELTEKEKQKPKEKREYDSREEEVCERLRMLRDTFDTMILMADPERVEPDETIKVKAEVISTLVYLKSTITAYYDTAMSLFGYAADSEEEGWTPPADTNIVDMK